MSEIHEGRDGRPDGAPCPECAELMEVRRVDFDLVTSEEHIQWQVCAPCGVGWSATNGWVDITEEDGEPAPPEKDVPEARPEEERTGGFTSFDDLAEMTGMEDDEDGA